MHLNRTVICAALTAACVSAAWQQQSNVVRSHAPDLRVDPVEFAHLVVRGTVASVDEKTISMADWGSNVYGSADKPYYIYEVRLNVTEVLKGYLAQSGLGVSFNRAALGDLEKGDEVVLCAYYNRQYLGGRYIIRDIQDSFLSREGTWYQQGSHDEIALEAVRGKIRDTSLPNVTRKSDLILRGRVVSMQTGLGPGEVTGRITKTAVWTIEVIESLKGDPKSTSVSFSMILDGDAPEWRSRVPYDLMSEDKALGEEVVVFLKRTEHGLYPFAGTNGFFQVRGNEVILDSRVTLRQRTKAFTEQIVQEVHGE